MKIYHSSRPYKDVHLSRSCPGAKRAYQLVESTMDQIGSRDLCSICFPRWPKPKVLHRTCELCKPGQSKPYPCCHNGGVEVLAPAGEVERRIYVWPEHAYRYRLAPPAIRV